MNRRDAVRGLLAAGLAAVPALALADVTTLKLTDAFPFLKEYYRLPADKRSRFSLAYYAIRDREPAPNLKAAIVGPDGKRTPLALDGQGKVLQLPDAATLRSGATLAVEAPATAKIGFRLEAQPNVTPSTHMEPRALALALAQVNAAAKTLAGILSFAAPKVVAVYFPDADDANAVLEDGKSKALPVAKPKGMAAMPYFEPEADPDVKTLAFGRAPSRIMLGLHPGA